MLNKQNNTLSQSVSPPALDSIYSKRNRTTIHARSIYKVAQLGSLLSCFVSNIKQTNTHTTSELVKIELRNWRVLWIHTSDLERKRVEGFKQRECLHFQWQPFNRRRLNYLKQIFHGDSESLLLQLLQLLYQRRKRENNSFLVSQRTCRMKESSCVVSVFYGWLFSTLQQWFDACFWDRIR